MMNENEIPEIVASKDLREVFAAKPVVRGTFFLNRIEIVPFAAAGVASVLEQINRYADKTFVDASVDENYHLVLEARSPAPILIRIGRLLDPAAGQDERNMVLVDLGLPETQPGLAATAVVHGVAPGPTPEERRRLRLERAVKSGAIPASALNQSASPSLRALGTASAEAARRAWQEEVAADFRQSHPSEQLPEWLEDLATFTQPPASVAAPMPTTPASMPDTVESRGKLPEIGWGGDIDNRGPVGFPS